MQDLERRLTQIGKGVVQINLRLGKVLAAVEAGPGSDRPDALEPLFDLIDAIDRAVEAMDVPAPAPPWWARWLPTPAPTSGTLDGLRLARQRAIDQLRSLGVESAPLQGPCDPRLHEVIDTVPATGSTPPDTVHRTHRRGWTLRGEPPVLLRTAHVTAWKAP